MTHCCRREFISKNTIYHNFAQEDCMIYKFHFDMIINSYLLMQMNFDIKLLSDKPKKLDYGYLTSAYTALLEKEILLNPSHWLWSHKRWKREIPENLESLKEQQKEQFEKRFRSQAK